VVKAGWNVLVVSFATEFATTVSVAFSVLITFYVRQPC